MIVRAGSVGLAAAASLIERDRNRDSVVIEQSEEHYDQPGWTMLVGGVFDSEDTCRSEASVAPAGFRWVKVAVASFDPERASVTLEGELAFGRVLPHGLERWAVFAGGEPTSPESDCKSADEREPRQGHNGIFETSAAFLFDCGTGCGTRIERNL